jgi:hypothetical protein
MQLPTDENSIKLHTDHDGHVWYSVGIGTTQNSGQIADTFLRSKIVNGQSMHIRLLGVPQNAELFIAFYLRRRQNEVASLEIAGPNVCENLAELADPETVVYRMRTTQLTSACGGWHTATDADYWTYALIGRLERSGGHLDQLSTAYLRTHPAYRALSLLPTLSPPHVAQVIKTIVDPRWYVDRRAPERQGKLELYLGLTPRIQRRVSDSSALLIKSRELRCATVLEAWKTQHPGAVDLTDPRNFLYRIYKASGAGVRGDLRGSQAFIRYLRYNWLDAADMRKGAKDGLFAPELFFKTPAERATYELHMKR